MLSSATRFRLGPNLGVTAFVQDSYDSLLTRYEVSGIESVKSIAVIDRDSIIVVIIPYQPSTFGTLESARQFLDEIVRWEKFRSDLEVPLTLDPIAKRVAGGGFPIHHRFAGLSRFKLL